MVWQQLTLFFLGILAGAFALIGFVGLQPFREVFKQAWRRVNRNSDDKLNCLFIGRNGKLSEKLLKIQDNGTVEPTEGEQYAINPNLQFMYHAVPTQLYVEGKTEPFDMASEEIQSKLTTKELNALMIGSEATELVSLLKKIAPNIKYITYGLLIFMAGILYVAFQNMQTLSSLTGESIGEILKPE